MEYNNKMHRYFSTFLENLQTIINGLTKGTSPTGVEDVPFIAGELVFEVNFFEAVAKDPSRAD